MRGPKHMREPFDAIVIGGGPAGAMAALLLAGRGRRIALIERGERNRDKTCGHCLSPRIAPLLERAGLLDRVRAIATGRTGRVRIHTPGRKAATFKLNGGGTEAGWLVDRRLFDQSLIDAAAERGVCVFQPAPARVVQRGADGAVVIAGRGDDERRLRTRLVIGADGLQSMTARVFGLDVGAQRGRKYGFSFNLDCSASAPVSGVIDMFTGAGGYLGVVPGPGGALHGAGLVGTRSRGARDPIGFTREMAVANPTLARLLGAGAEMYEELNIIGSGPMPLRRRRIAGEGVALVGDAAGYHEPFTGEGMAWAIESAFLLDQAFAETGGAWSTAAAARYEQLWRHSIGRRMLACRAVAFALERPALLRLGLRAGAAGADIPRRYFMRQAVTA